MRRPLSRLGDLKGRFLAKAEHHYNLNYHEFKKKYVIENKVYQGLEALPSPSS